ncbi:MAG: efflux RND transporter periplasmic adaptor subunit [Phycisphaerae bacterium]
MNSRSTIGALAVVFTLGIGVATAVLYRAPRLDLRPRAASAKPGTTSQTAARVIATVQTTPIIRKRITESLVCYGTVVARASSIRNVSVPFQAQVLRILVAGGQHVQKNEALLQLESTNSELLTLARAKSGEISARQQLAEVQQKFVLHLATRQSLLVAQQAVQLAQLNLANLNALGIGGPRLIKAPSSGVVSKILSGPGQIVSAGGPLLQLVSSRNIEVQLGLEPEDSVRVHRGQTVALTPVGEHVSGSMTGTVSLITRRVNPATRLVDVFVTPQPRSGLLLGQYVEGKVVIATATGLVVPRAAVLPVGNNEALYTVKNGRAVLHLVHIGLANAHELQVVSGSLTEGQSAVIVGNAELINGMAVTGKFKP